MFEFFEMKNVFFDFLFRFCRGGMRRLVPHSLAKALIRRKRTKVELPMQHYDEVKEQKRSMRSSFESNLFLAD